MYLSDRDLEDAVTLGHLIVNPPPAEYDTSSIDLHLDAVETAKIWDADAYAEEQTTSGFSPAVLRVGSFDGKKFASKFHRPIAEDSTKAVFRDGKYIVVKPQGFFLWQTKEEVGTPEDDPRLICFIDGKSTKARTGLLVHMTAPNIHAGWWGKVTLEIANLGPFNLGLAAGDAIAQIVVARLTSFPAGKKKARGVKVGQQSVTGENGPKPEGILPPRS